MSSYWALIAMCTGVVCLQLISLRLMLCKQEQYYKLYTTIANIIKGGFQELYSTGT